MLLCGLWNGPGERMRLSLQPYALLELMLHSISVPWVQLDGCFPVPLLGEECAFFLLRVVMSMNPMLTSTAMAPILLAIRILVLAMIPLTSGALIMKSVSVVLGCCGVTKFGDDWPVVVEWHSGVGEGEGGSERVLVVWMGDITSGISWEKNINVMIFKRKKVAYILCVIVISKVYYCLHNA